MRDFNHSIDILIKAYMDDDLIQGSCASCAVGNLISSAINKELCSYTDLIMSDMEDRDKLAIYHWAKVFRTVVDVETEEVSHTFNIDQYSGEAKDQIDSTGYSPEELARIEYAFEMADENSEDDLAYNGLIAVIDVLADIHGIDLSVKEEFKSKIILNHGR